MGETPLHFDLRRLTAAASLLAGIVEGSDDAIIAKDLDGCIIAWNPAAERMFGYAERDAIGKHVNMLIPDDHRGEDEVVFARIREGKTVEHYETQRVAKDGRLVDVSVTVSPIRDLDGTLVGASKIIRDISEQLQSSAAQAQLAAIVESSDDAIISKGVDGRILSWNPAAQRLFGYEPEEVIGKHISMLFPDDLKGSERDILSEILQGKKVDHYETRRVTKDGKVVDVSLTVSPLRDTSGRIIGASKIIRDISERKEAEVRRELADRLAAANEQLAAADRAKDQFFAMANHELRTPLTTIAGFTETLLRLDLDEEQRRSFLEIIESQTDRLTRLVEDLLTLSRNQVDTSTIAPRVLDVASTIDQVLVESNHSDVVCDVPLGLTVCADPHHFHQMVRNYLDNAAKYGKGSVQLIARVSDDEEFIVLEVRDDGPGVPDELLPRLYGRFSRAKRDMEAGTPGTGLGLAIVRGLARAHGGDAWYEPRDPQGARFCLRLPARELCAPENGVPVGADARSG